MRPRRRDWKIHDGEIGQEAEADSDRADDQGRPAEERTFRNPGWKAIGTAQTRLTIYADDFSVLLGRGPRRLRKTRWDEAPAILH